MNRKIDKLRNDIEKKKNEIADRLQRNKEINPSKYFLQSSNYEKIFDLTGNKTDLINAIDSITEAIVKSTEAQYIGKRVELYIKNEEFEKAAEDIIEITKLYPITGVIGMYVNKIKKDALKIKEIQDIIFS